MSFIAGDTVEWNRPNFVGSNERFENWPSFDISGSASAPPTCHLGETFE